MMGGMKDTGGQQSRFKWMMEGHSPAPSPPDTTLHKNGNIWAVNGIFVRAKFTSLPHHRLLSIWSHMHCQLPSFTVYLNEALQVSELGRHIHVNLFDLISPSCADPKALYPVL